MSQKRWITNIVFILILPVVPIISQNNKESELLKTLLQNYDNLSRPVKNSLDILQLELGFTLSKILHVNEKAQMITTNIWLHTQWNDSYLAWNPGEYDNITTARIPINKIWHPDLTHYNAVEEQQFNNEGARNTVVKYTGTVIYVPSMVLKSSCIMDITWFPFDEQTCEVNFGSWTYSGLEIDIKVNSEVGLESYVKNGEWNLLEVTSTRNVNYYPCCEEPYINVLLSIRIERKSLYYFFNLIVPALLIGFLAILSFTLPPDSGEKLTLGVTVLFSLIMFLNIISQSMPANADKIPLLGTYFTCIMFTIASSVVSTIVVNLSQRSEGYPKEISARTKSVFLEWMPRLLRMDPRNSMTGKNQEVAKQDEKEGNCFLKTVYEKSSTTRNKSQVLQDWKFIALVVDRLCLIASLIFTVFASILLIVSSKM